MEKAASGYPKFATAWLSLGTLQAAQSDSNGALKSYARAIAADDKFAPPYIESAVLEAGAGQWDKVVDHTNIAISLGPDSFPRAYYLSAFANFMLKRGDAAKKSVAEGLRVDEDHEYPDLEYIDGILRMTYGDVAGARKQLQSYLDLAPNGANAANARQQLMDLPKAN
jgi:tetratricopeptide (TPR) repeat protein